MTSWGQTLRWGWMVDGVPFVYTFRLCMCITLYICGNVGCFMITVCHLFLFLTQSVSFLRLLLFSTVLLPSAAIRSEFTVPPWLWIINPTVCQCGQGLMNTAKWNYTFKTIMHDWDKWWHQRVCILAELLSAVSVVGRLLSSRLLSVLSVPKIAAY